MVESDNKINFLAAQKDEEKPGAVGAVGDEDLSSFEPFEQGAGES